MTYAIFALAGLLVGSFLNVCIYRMPRNESIVWPGSHCGSCNKPVAWYDNIPVISFILLLAKCRSCKAKISFQYPIVEILGALVAAASWWRWQALPLPYAIMSCVILWALIVVIWIDWQHQIIPDEISLSGIVAGLVFSVFFPAWHSETTHKGGIIGSILGILIGGGFLLSLTILAEKILKKEAMGGGDIKFLAAAGAFLGWSGAFFTLFAGSILGSIGGIFLRLTTKNEQIPFGPFLSAGFIIAFFWGPQLISWYLHSVLQY